MGDREDRILWTLVAVSMLKTSFLLPYLFVVEDRVMGIFVPGLSFGLVRPALFVPTKFQMVLTDESTSLGTRLVSFYKIGLILSQTNIVFTCLQYKSPEDNVGKGEIAPNEHFLLFPQCFLSL